MRILVICNVYPPPALGGYEVECMGVVEHLRRSHEVEVLTSTLGGGTGPEPGVHRVMTFATQAMSSSLLAPVHAASAAAATRRLNDRFRPEFVYVFNGAAIPHTAIRQLALSGVPMAVRVCEHWFGDLYSGDRFLRHITPGETGARGVWARGMRAINRAHPGLRVELRTPTPWAVSWNSEFLRGAVPVPANVEIVYEDLFLPVNPRVPRFAEVPRNPDAAHPVVFFAGRLDDRKGADVAVRALAALRDRHGIAADLVLAGEGADREALARLAAELGVAGRVTFPGRLDFEQMSERLATATAWLVPSVWEEPAPTVALEAALARVPAVLSRVGGTSEVLREETEALFFARGDHDGCADALARTIAEPEATEGRVARAHERAGELSWDAYLRSTDRFVENALAALRAR